MIMIKEERLESTLGSDLARLVRLWRALIDEKLKPLDLTQSHWVTLYNVNRLPLEQSQTQIQLAKAIGIEQPSLVRTLDQLEDKALITRHCCSNDRRAKRIKLTSEASDTIKKVENVIHETSKDILQGISEVEIKLLSNLIEKIEKNIKDLQDIKNTTVT